MNTDKRPKVICFLLLSFCFFPWKIFAQDVGITELEKFYAEEPMVLVASQQEENLKETPVITNIITAEEIKRMGARTLNEVLLTIPGFSRIQDHNEYYSAARSIYGSSQQKILVLRDGHRLNSRCYSEANFGPAIGLANVKRIEVMRGPGSTIYGDVALTAVINIVTKDGKDITGTEATVGVGNFGQKKIDVITGQDLGQGRDISFFASIYESKGEKQSVNAAYDYSATPASGDVILDRFKARSSLPPHDIGIKYKTGDLHFSYAHRYEHYTMPRAGGGGYGQLIEHDAYREFEGEGVGASSEFQHLELKYVSTIQNDVTFTFRPYFDTFVFRDNEPQRRAGESGALAGQPKGYFMKWMERSYGLQTTASQPYNLENLGEGSILTGLQVEQMDLYDSWDIHSPDTTHSDWWLGAPEVLKRGTEEVYGVFSQVKHSFTEQVILNSGLRYDYKDRLTGKSVGGLSPRVALIYLPDKKWNYRLMYGKSFVDSPYWYRYNQMGGGYAGGVNLRPEWLESFQFTVGLNAPKYLTNSLNIFFNDVTDVIFRNTGGQYTNAGEIKTQGVEYEVGIKKENISLRSNYTYQYSTKSLGYAVEEGMVANIPSHMANLIIDYAPLYSLKDINWGKDLWVNLSVRYAGKQFAPWGSSSTYSGQDLNYMEPEAFIFNLGFNLEKFINEKMSFRFHIYNLFDEDYRQGGSVNLPYEQPGRWYLARLTYKW